MPALLFSQLFDYSQSTRTHLHADNVLLADRDRERERYGRAMGVLCI